MARSLQELEMEQQVDIRILFSW